MKLENETIELLNSLIMVTNKINSFIAFIAVALMVACQSTTGNKETHSKAEGAASTITHSAPASYKIGDRVPHDLVCMVNNDYMGKKQMEVPFEGKTYYGCCQMCVDRIPNDPAARTAVDPLTKKAVDKADAYIVLVNEKGNVAYFENEENYVRFLEQL